jgi:hypothetical protein
MTLRRDPEPWLTSLPDFAAHPSIEGSESIMKPKSERVSWLVELGGVVLDSVETGAEQKVSVSNPDGNLLTLDQARGLFLSAMSHLGGPSHVTSHSEAAALQLCELHVREAKTARANYQAMVVQVFESEKRLAVMRAELEQARQHAATHAHGDGAHCTLWGQRVRDVLHGFIERAEEVDICPGCGREDDCCGEDCLVVMARDLLNGPELTQDELCEREAQPCMFCGETTLNEGVCYRPECQAKLEETWNERKP